MKETIVVPNSLRSAARELRHGFAGSVEQLPRNQFLKVWSAIFYLFPGLHPDGFDDAESGWPRILKQFAAEAWHRVESGEMSEDELYPSDAQWSGLYDRMYPHKPDEIHRRLALAADYGEPLNA
jgi:hypothetical protein